MLARKRPYGLAVQDYTADSHDPIEPLFADEPTGFPGSWDHDSLQDAMISLRAQLACTNVWRCTGSMPVWAGSRVKGAQTALDDPRLSWQILVVVVLK